MRYDYIIVGAGSAGCVIANRLSADPSNQVLLIEAGGSDRRFFIQMPIGYGVTYHQRAVNWMYTTEPSPDADNKPSYWPRGKVLGGSSSINAMVYVRGNPKDFDEWSEMGNSGWSYRDVLPILRKWNPGRTALMIIEEAMDHYMSQRYPSSFTRCVRTF